MRFSAFSTLLLTLLLAFAGPAAAQVAGAPSHATARLISPITAAGQSTTVPVAVEIVLEDGWKTYWRSPGDAGLAPVFDWTGSQNIAKTEVHYPAPHRFTAADLDNYGYGGKVVFPIDITPATRDAALELRLKLDILVCHDVCIPETKQLSLSLPAGNASPSPDADAYQYGIDRLPAAAGADDFAVQRAFIDYDTENRNYLVIEARAVNAPSKDADVFIEHSSGIVFGRPAVDYDRVSNTLTLRAPAPESRTIDALNEALNGQDIVVTLTDGGQALETTVAVSDRPAGEAVMGPGLAEKAREFDLRILLIAFIGGMILNLMPCVLPVLSIKILSVLSHGGKNKQENRGQIFRNFMASALGILFSFWIMAGSLAALKSAGQSIGWGIQFQHPAFLLFLIVLLVGFAANMFDLFDIPLPRFIARNIPAKHEHEPTLIGHFLMGAFATLLATPCTAPFLGTAVGFALARGTFEIFVIFTCLGLGLALPYILLAVSPGLFRFMPKPGRWMRTMKKVLALLLLVTAGWLASVLITVTATPALDAGWEKFDVARIAPAVQNGQTVIVDVTADWCLTCKANKKLVLQTKEIVAAISADNIVRLQADWTHRDEAIADYLRSFGKYGIPFNVVYGPRAPRGIVLPELLTQDAVLHALTEATGE